MSSMVQPRRPALFTSMSMGVPRNSSASAAICSGLLTSSVCSEISAARIVGERGKLGGRLRRAAAGVDAPAVAHELAHHLQAEPSARTGDQHRRHRPSPPLASERRQNSGRGPADKGAASQAKPRRRGFVAECPETSGEHIFCKIYRDKARYSETKRDMGRPTRTKRAVWRPNSAACRDAACGLRGRIGRADGAAGARNRRNVPLAASDSVEGLAPHAGTLRPAGRAMHRTMVRRAGLTRCRAGSMGRAGRGSARPARGRLRYSPAAREGAGGDERCG